VALDHLGFSWGPTVSRGPRTVERLLPAEAVLRAPSLVSPPSCQGPGTQTLCHFPSFKDPQLTAAAHCHPCGKYLKSEEQLEGFPTHDSQLGRDKNPSQLVRKLADSPDPWSSDSTWKGKPIHHQCSVGSNWPSRWIRGATVSLKDCQCTCKAVFSFCFS
jgi:hypothetical protein